jgi:hypothetical protein
VPNMWGQHTIAQGLTLNVSAFCGIEGSFRDYVGGV